MKNPLTYLFLILIVFGNGVLAAVQTPSEEVKTGTLVKRVVENGKDNYVYAAYSFKFGGNGPEIQKLCRNNWDLLFGNSPMEDTFGVTMVTDDRSRIKDVGAYHWVEKFRIARLAAYEEPDTEDGVRQQRAICTWSTQEIQTTITMHCFVSRNLYPARVLR